MNPLVEEYIEALRPHLQRLGLEDLTASIEAGRLLLTPVPSQVIPVRFELSPRVPGQRYFKSNGVVGLVHGRLPDGVAPSAEMEALSEWLVRLATARLVRSLGPLRRKEPRLWNLSLPSLVARGLKPAAIVNTENRSELIQRIVSEVPAAVPSTYAYIQDSLNRFTWAKEGELPPGRPGHRLVYCAQEMQTATLLRELDWLTYTSGGHSSEQQARIGVILGYPECCAAAYERDPNGEPEMEDVRWLRAYVRAAEARWKAADLEALPGTATLKLFSCWTNLLAARMAHMVFFEHLPCSPWCQATEANNRRVTTSLFGPQCESWLRPILSVSFFCWSDGAMVPFRCGSVVGQQVEIQDVGTAWTEGVMDHFQRRFSNGAGLLPAAPADIKALRRTQRGWELLANDQWHWLGAGRSAPMVLVFES